MPLAHVTEKNGILVVTQTNKPALHDLGTSLTYFVGFILLYYVFWSPANNTLPAAAFIFLSFPGLYLLIQALNQFFGKETFTFDKNEGVFIRNGFTVGPLSDIRRVTAQVSRGVGQNPKFRLVLELPRCQTVTVVITADTATYGNFSLSRNGFSDPNKRFAIFEPWLDYEDQNLIPFLPSEIGELQQRIREFING